MSIQIVLMTHGKAGEALVESSKMIVGDQINVQCLSLLPGMAMETLMMQAKEVAEKSEEVLFLVDLYGGTPSNVAVALSGIINAKCVSGVNLGMLMESLITLESSQNISLEELQRIAYQAGSQAVKQYEYSELGG